MAVGCLVMVDAVTSGVVYTADPASSDTGVIIINSVWGLGPSVVDGAVDTDVYMIRKGDPLQVIETRIGRKEEMTVTDPKEMTRQAQTPEELRNRPSLSMEEAQSLALQAIAIENYYGSPQDIEWSLGRDGALYFLQARPLRLDHGNQRNDAVLSLDETQDHPVIFKNQVIVVKKGAASGRAFVLSTLAGLEKFPKGAVLVAKKDSPYFIRVMPYAAAIITDIGAIASHMASVCREFNIPTLVNTSNDSQLIRHGQEITISCTDDHNSIVYDGQVGALTAAMRQDSIKMEGLYEFRRKKYFLRHISLLNLVNPLEDEFTPENCRTLHDILRFIHEKSVQKIIDASHKGGNTTGPGCADWTSVYLPD